MKHLFKRTVVLLNRFEGIEPLLQKAKDFATIHETTLEILYVHEAPLFDVPDYFLSESKIANEYLDKGKVRVKIEEQLASVGVSGDHVILIYEDDTVDQVMHYAKGDKSILFITEYHPELSHQLIEKTPHTFWIIKNPHLEHYKKVVIPIDFTSEAKRVLELSKKIFKQSHISMVHDYRYLLDTVTVPIDYLDINPIVTPEVLALNEVVKKEREETFESFKKEFGLDGVCIDAEGSLDQDLMAYIAQNRFDLIVMYHQDSDFFLSPSLIVYLLDDLDLDFFIFNL